jgi:hypothetical protein
LGTESNNFPFPVALFLSKILKLNPRIPQVQFRMIAVWHEEFDYHFSAVDYPSSSSLFGVLYPAALLVSFHLLNPEGALCSHNQPTFSPPTTNHIQIPQNSGELQRINEALE